MSTISTALALNTKAAKAINPPAKKSEIIEALAIRKHAMLTEQAAKATAAYDTAKAELFRLACAIKNASNAPTYVKECVREYRQYTRPHLSLSVKSFDFYVEDFTPEMKVQLRIMERIEKGNTRFVPASRTSSAVSATP